MIDDRFEYTKNTFITSKKMTTNDAVLALASASAAATV